MNKSNKVAISDRLLEELPLLPLLVYLISLHDPYGRKHSQRVALLSIRLAKTYGYKDLNTIETSALLHDIGKIGIPEYIRRIPGEYTEVERILMQQHVTIGENLLRMVQNGVFNETIFQNVRHHHENWGGSGYPDNLFGDAIPLGARIIRICDYYDALTNVRGYSESKSHQKALEEMVNEDKNKRLFDPNLFSVFINEEFWKSA